ncbi:site-specific integrase [Candidatus Nitrosotalea bavarica]|uniref:site-specific integrase n=1 Tax=Candidatus Nitrosotalea bavarica TaxID=1903277 RepID=UPI000C7009D6|nr:site-specific integrase [Candidatus Nitrosotalea bavarica]
MTALKQIVDDNDYKNNKEVNTTKRLVLTDEDCIVQSDVGKKLTYEKIQTTTAKQHKITKKDSLLSNQDIRRWYDNLARSSGVTAEVRLRKLNRFCENNKITPMELVELGQKDSRAVADLIEDTITTMEKQHSAPQYIKAMVTAVKSWLHHHDIEVRRKIRIANSDSTPSLVNERVPDDIELKELFNRANLRAGAIMAMIGKAGLRPEVLGKHDASDGLMIRDLPELDIVLGIARFQVVPPRVIVRKTLSKAGHTYFTFISESGAEKVLAYLNERMASGEMLNSESPVIAPSSKLVTYRGKHQGKKFMTTSVICQQVRRTMRPRFPWRPYVLRAFFDTQLLIAESRGKIAHDFRVFFMGHTGSIEAKYTTNKSILPKLLTDEMRESFRKSQEFLDLEVNAKKEENISPEKIVTVEEFEKLISEGWQYVATLPNDKILVKNSRGS